MSEAPKPHGHGPEVTVNTATIVSPETKEEMKKGHWGHFFKLLTIDLGVVAAVMGMRALYDRTRMTKEEHEELEKVRKHAHEGNFTEAFKVLRRLPFGVGQNDEEIFDEDLMEAVEKKYATSEQSRSLERWLANDRTRRRKFRHALTLQPSAEIRAKLVGDYAKLTDIQRNIRLKAVGKLDPSPAQDMMPTVIKHASEITNPEKNGLQKLLDWDNRSLFTRVSKFLIR